MKLRELERRDLPAVVALYRRAFEETPPVPDDRLAAYFAQIFFDHPWASPELPSLACEEGGEITGFLGVTPQRLTFDGEPVRSVATSHFMVDPSRRGSLAAVRLLRELFEAGRQDLALAEGNDLSRRIWESVGGDLSVAYSVHWVSPLRPVAYGLAKGDRGPPAVVARVVAAPLDTLLARLPGPFRRSAPNLHEEPLDIDTFVNMIQQVTAPFRVRPDYDRRSAAWLFALLERKAKLGRLRRSMLRDDAGAPAGWCIWFEHPGAVSHLVQVGAVPARADDVHAWLFREAWRGGSIALAGRLSPEYFRAQAGRTAVLSRGQSWMLLHSRNPALLAAIHAGRAFLTRLESEWWIPFDEA